MTEQELSNLEKNLKQLNEAMESQKALRPEADPGELLFSITDKDHKPQTVDEFNAKGEEMHFVCMRVEDQPEPFVPTATGKKCEDCGAGVWMSPGTYGTWLRVKNARILCIQCSFKLVGEDYEALKAEAKGGAGSVE